MRSDVGVAVWRSSRRDEQQKTGRFRLLWQLPLPLILIQPYVLYIGSVSGEQGEVGAIHRPYDIEVSMVECENRGCLVTLRQNAN
jgi:hypothetical protein